MRLADIIMQYISTSTIYIKSLQYTGLHESHPIKLKMVTVTDTTNEKSISYVHVIHLTELTISNIPFKRD